MFWQIRIQAPSGETRTLPLKGSATLGRSEECSIVLKDPTIPQEAALLWAASEPSTLGETNASPFWIRVNEESPDKCSLTLGDLHIREAHVPSQVPFQLGETLFSIEPADTQTSQPPQPLGIRHWKTQGEEGSRVLWMAKKAAATPLSIYLAGETGTGKEVLAHLIHAWSERASGPFIPINCGALTLSLAESELFGHVKGAFTGAVIHRPGALMQAHNGTLFLDEVADLSLDIQVKLLRFLENGEIRPVGADRFSRADVRLLCATHQPLKKLVEEGKFRRDLYYRIASVTIEIPPLRTRPKDIELLAREFGQELDRSLSPRAMQRLQAHAWPGNVRELRHAIERASGLAGPFSKLLHEDAFEFLISSDSLSHTPELELGCSVLKLSEMERVLILKALKISDGNRRKAAKILGVARSTLFEMLKRHQIQGPRHDALKFAS
ncbi:sigma 54-interacting transcriptional regulator [Bdellovibrionota bacterium FG-2]